MGRACSSPAASGVLLARDTAVFDAMPRHLHERMADLTELHVATIRRAHELGVTIAMGTDAGTPANHHGLNAEECVILVERAGMSPAESIASATVNAARLLRQEEHLGSLDVGKHADVIGVRQNPLDDIAALMHVAFVMSGGEVVRNDLV